MTVDLEQITVTNRTTSLLHCNMGDHMMYIYLQLVNVQ